MKLLGIFRFEFAYQVRRLTTWLPFALLGVVAYLFVRKNFLADALYADFFINSPYVIAVVTVFCSLFWLLVAAGVAGQVAARDAETGMHPLTYTVPVRKADYLGGRFLAAFVLNALIMLAVPAGILLAVYTPGVDAQVIGPFRPAAYLAAYVFFALPNAFIGTAIQFSVAALGRRAIGSYLGSVLLFGVVYGGIFLVMIFLQRQEYAVPLDALAHLTIFDITLGWTPIEKGTRMIALEGTLLRRRLLWLGIACAVLAFTYARFHFAHHAPTPWWSRIARRRAAHAPTPAASAAARTAISVPRVAGTFGLALYARQTLAIAWTSFRTIAKSRGGLVLTVPIAVIAVMVLPQRMESMGTPLLPRTEYLLTFLTAPLAEPMTPWVIIPLLIVLWAGELAWREREAGLGEITDAAPVPGWVPFLGKLLALGLVLAAWMLVQMATGLLVQARMGYHAFEIGLYLEVLFGLQLPEYLLFALLALVVQGLVTQKYLGHVAALVAYALILFAARLGVGHHLLVYGSAPRWVYSDIRGFGSSLGPWRWFMLYWAAWALLLAVAATLLWMRGLEGRPRMRLRLARGRITRPTAGAAALAAALILGLGGFIFYNTNVLNEYRTASGVMERRAEYERRYGRYANVPQPRLTGVRLRVEIHPGRREAEIRGTYQLVNRTAAPIDTIHLAPAPGAETGAVRLDRPARRVVADDALWHHAYALAAPLQPGDSLRLGFTVRVKPRGFRNGGVDRVVAVTAKSTYFRSQDWLPAIGYQASRELLKPGERRAHGLPARPILPTLAVAEGQDITGEAGTAGPERIAFEAVVGTDADQTAVAPGTLRRAWTEGGRRYFHYATDAPIGSEYALFSAAYAVHEERWTPPAGAGQPVTIQVYHHPQHAAGLDGMLRSVRASLDVYTRAYGPYPHGRLIRLVENPGTGIGAHAEPTTIDYSEGFSRFDPAEDPRGLDLPFGVVAHEMAHEWGVPYALAEGAPLLTESFAWYAAMGVIERTYGREHLRRLLRFFRQPSPIPPIRQSVPLLRAMDPYAAYRKGPFALYAMSEYMGRERVDRAFRRLMETHRSDEATSLDLYRELQAVTPDSLRPLLHDLFAANTFWELETERATARRTAAGGWQVTLRVKARKVTVDPAGRETVVPMDEWVPIGVFAPTEQGADFGETLYLRMHRIRSGEQTITVTVPRKPSDAGIDPYVVLIDLERFDNVEEVEIVR
jgi:ABC-type transport system involved in multi-copper enzyme maturation permease subunit